MRRIDYRLTTAMGITTISVSAECAIEIEKDWHSFRVTITGTSEYLILTDLDYLKIYPVRDSKGE